MRNFLLTCRLFTSLAVLMALAGITQLRAQGPDNNGLFIDLPNPPAAPAGQRPTATRRRGVSINFQHLRDSLPPQAGGNGSSNRLHLNLFADADFTAVRGRVEQTDTGFVWVGQLQNEPDSQVTLAIAGTASAGGVMSGNVVTSSGTFSIRSSPAGEQVIEQVDLASFPPELPPLAPSMNAAGSQPVNLARDVPQASVDDGSTIDLLVVYTPAARAAAGGTAAMQSLIDLGVSETNQAYANSGAIQRLRLRRKEEIAYTESGSMFTDLPRLQTSGDGYMDSVQSLRNTYGADLIQLIVNSPDACGLAYVQDPINSTFAPFAFGVVHYSCISPNYSFGHEMGHNMGLQHDTYVNNSTTPFTYSHGYVNQAAFAGGASASKRWRTIMAYNDQCAANGFNCTRLLYFSNPNNTNTSDPMGDANTANATLALDNSRVTVANFRASVVPLDNYANARDIFSNFFTDSLDTSSFTTEGTDPTPSCGGGVKSKSAWYRFTAGVSGVAMLDTLGSGYDTILAVYTGTAGAFAEVGCNDDANATPQSVLSFTVTPGTTYSIMISAKAANGGTLLLNAAVPIIRKRTGQLTSE
jgi:hypothetical protein